MAKVKKQAKKKQRDQALKILQNKMMRIYVFEICLCFNIKSITL